MKVENELKLKYGIWGLVAGAAGAMIIGFSWGGWTTRGTSQGMTDTALLSTRAAICVAQFVKAPNEKQRFKEFQAVNSWERSTYIEKGGWDRMPGEDKANDTVARACAEGVSLLADKRPQ